MGWQRRESARLAREVAKRVRDAAGDQVAVIAKLNMADGVPGGLWLDDSVEIARLLEADGALDAIELTGGSSFQNPMYLFRGEAPIREMAAAFPSRSAPDSSSSARSSSGISVRGGVLPALCTTIPRRVTHAAHPSRRHQPARHDRAGAERRLRVRRDGQGPPPTTGPGSADAGGPRHGITLRPLQQMHANHLRRDPLRPGSADERPGHATQPR